MSWPVLALAAVLFFLAIWIVVPAPTMTLLTFSVGAPEISPLLLGPALITVFLAWRRRRHRAGRVALALSAIASGLFAMPLVQYPRSAPLSATTLLAGVDMGQSRLTRDVPMGSPGGVALTVDIYQPMTNGPHPTIVQIYGGAWQRGVPGNDPVFAARFASSGYVVFAIDYRHAPAWKWPAQLEDVQMALAWVRENGPQYGANPSKLALFGRSAGSQLAMVAGLQDPGVSAVISYYGPVNLTQDGGNHRGRIRSAPGRCSKPSLAAPPTRCRSATSTPHRSRMCRRERLARC